MGAVPVPTAYSPKFTLEERVLRSIVRERLIPERGRVLVALSGGADSVALTVLLNTLQASSRFTLTGVVHLNHQMRPAADHDERFCRELSEQLLLRFEVDRMDVRSQAKAAGISTEEAGHRARYKFFGRVLRESNADRLATAHNCDDQAETYLMRLIRGAGPEGLGGIRWRLGQIIRPLLDVSGAELRAYLAAREIQFREDETNQDLSITRNRVRHELLPLLRERFSSAIVNVLVRDAEIARRDAEWLDTAANEQGATIVTEERGRISVDVPALGRQPVALARRIAKRALEQVAKRTVGFNDVERLLDLVRDPGCDEAADFPGCRVELDADRLWITRPRSRHKRAAAGFVYPLAVPGEVKVPEAGLVISATPTSTDKLPGDTLTVRGSRVVVAAGLLSNQLVVRSWKPGDVVRPLGLGGSKKLQDFFVDRKVARSARQKVPIVADRKKGIVWVVGHTVAEDFRVSADTAGMLILRARKLGGTE